MRKVITVLFSLIVVFLAVAQVQSVQAQAAWAPNTAYSINQLVTYAGHTYKCIQAHTSQVGWEPSTTAALWQDMGPTGGATVPPNTPVPPTAPPSGTNLALNRPTTASGSCNVNEGPAKAVNGSVSGGNTDKWCSNTATKWMQVDLGASFNLTRFIIKHAGTGGENAAWNTNAFNIQISGNASTWTTVVTVSGNTASTTTHNITAASGRYVRLNVTNAGGDGVARIYEFEVYGSGGGTVPTSTTVPPTTVPPTNPPTGTNLALNRPATASGSCATTEGPDKAVNGSVTGGNTDKWCGNTATKWMQIDLGASFSLTKFVIKHAGTGGENAAWNTNAFNIQVSGNASTWTTVVTVSGNTASTTTHNITAASGRYVRLNVTNAGGDGVARIYEFEVYGSGGGTVPTNTSVPPTNVPPTTVPPTNPPPPPGGPITLGYFAEWGIYARAYHPKNIVTSGSASKITHINFAFGNVQGGACTIGDAFADYDKAYTAAESVDGVADTWDVGALRGIFGQFRKLKAAYPHIRILYSFGGWTWSGGFGAAAANATAFANSCYSLVEDPRWADVFDGIDIDWEYPNSCGLSCDTSGFGSFKTLMSALRSRFGSSYLVTAAITADGSAGGKIDAADYGGAAQYLNWYNVMTYDYFGAWAATGPTAPHSPLTSYAGIPIAGFNSDAAIQKLKGKGVPASKLLLGIGFYGRGWTGVSQAAPGGSASGAAPGTYEAGIEDYKKLVTQCPANGTVAGTAYAFCAPQWWSYDTPSTIASKMTYKKQQGLGGAFFWEFTGDTANGALVTAMYNNR